MLSTFEDLAFDLITLSGSAAKFSLFPSLETAPANEPIFLRNKYKPRIIKPMKEMMPIGSAIAKLKLVLEVESEAKKELGDGEFVALVTLVALEVSIVLVALTIIVAVLDKMLLRGLGFWMVTRVVGLGKLKGVRFITRAEAVLKITTALAPTFVTEFGAKLVSVNKILLLIACCNDELRIVMLLVVTTTTIVGITSLSHIIAKVSTLIFV